MECPYFKKSCTNVQALAKELCSLSNALKQMLLSGQLAPNEVGKGHDGDSMVFRKSGKVHGSRMLGVSPGCLTLAISFHGRRSLKSGGIV